MFSKLKEKLGGAAIGALVASLAVAGALAMPATAQQVTGGPVASASHGMIKHVQRALQFGRVANLRAVRAIRVSRAAHQQAGQPGPRGPRGPRGEQGPKGDDAQVGALEDRIADLEAQVAGFETLLADVTRETVDGNDTLRFSDMNVQVVNGTNSTDGTPNGLGNLIIGYSTQSPSPRERDGSHYLVIGDWHEWRAFGGVIGGFANTGSGDLASVLSGGFNEASGNMAAVLSGSLNEASGEAASVLAGQSNEAEGTRSSVLGGSNNDASGLNECIPTC